MMQVPRCVSHAGRHNDPLAKWLLVTRCTKIEFPDRPGNFIVIPPGRDFNDLPAESPRFRGSTAARGFPPSVHRLGAHLRGVRNLSRNKRLQSPFEIGKFFFGRSQVDLTRRRPDTGAPPPYVRTRACTTFWEVIGRTPYRSAERAQR